MLHVGLTGGIASGKSRVLSRFAEAGFHAIDLDAASRTVMGPGGAAHAEILAAFGSRVLAPGGALDRKALAEIVFSDEAARRRLNRIVHPWIRAEEARLVAEHARDKEAIVVTDGALLVEAGVHLRFDRLVVVYCAREAQRARLMARDRLTAPEAEARIASQMPSEEKRRFAHFEVSSDGSPEETDRIVARTAEELRALPRVPEGPAPTLERALGVLLHGPERGPRGLDPRPLLRQIRLSGGVDLEELARRLVPPPKGAWHEAGDPTLKGPPPQSLVGSVVLWALSRRGRDVPFLLAATASLARLTHGPGEGAATACLAALALQHVLVSGGLEASLPDRLRGAVATAERWGGAAPGSASVLRSVETALRYPRDPARARAAGLEEPGDAGLAGALVGAAVGASPQGVPRDVLDDWSALVSAARGTAEP